MRFKSEMFISYVVLYDESEMAYLRSSNGLLKID